MNAALLSSKNMCWCTPQDFFDKLNKEFNFVLDAAATDNCEWGIADAVEVYPRRAVKIASIFEKHIQPFLRANFLNEEAKNVG